jgi:hypothetical protein
MSKTVVFKLNKEQIKLINDRLNPEERKLSFGILAKQSLLKKRKNYTPIRFDAIDIMEEHLEDLEKMIPGDIGMMRAEVIKVRKKFKSRVSEFENQYL